MPLDWMTRAAKELAESFSFGPGRDSYVTEEQRANVADNYRRIILKHCPLEPGVAYMPVPRCETCAYWKHRGIRNYCENTTINLRASLLFIPPIETDKNFGCVQWEPRV